MSSADEKGNSGAINPVSGMLDQMDAWKAHLADTEAEIQARRRNALAVTKEREEKHLAELQEALTLRLGRRPTGAEIDAAEVELSLLAIRFGSRSNAEPSAVSAATKNRPPAHRPSTSREAAQSALKSIYPPLGDPGSENRDAVLAFVNDWLRESGQPKVSRDTLRRAFQGL